MCPAERDELKIKAVDRGAICSIKPDTQENTLAKLRALQRLTSVGFHLNCDEANERRCCSSTPTCSSARSCPTLLTSAAINV